VAVAAGAEPGVVAVTREGPVGAAEPGTGAAGLGTGAVGTGAVGAGTGVCVAGRAQEEGLAWHGL
jgi:hypothetical protein